METTTKKKFDAVKMMREIRDNIDQELQSMTAEQRQDYYAIQREEFDRWKLAKNIARDKNS